MVQIAKCTKDLTFLKYVKIKVKGSVKGFLPQSQAIEIESGRFDFLCFIISNGPLGQKNTTYPGVSRETSMGFSATNHAREHVEGSAFDKEKSLVSSKTVANNFSDGERDKSGVFIDRSQFPVLDAKNKGILAPNNCSLEKRVFIQEARIRDTSTSFPRVPENKE